MTRSHDAPEATIDIDREAPRAVTHAARDIETQQVKEEECVDASADQAYAARVKDASKPVRSQLEVVRTELVDWYNHGDQATLHFPIKLYNMMLSLNDQVLGQDAAPNKQHGEILSDLGSKVDGQLR